MKRDAKETLIKKLLAKPRTRKELKGLTGFPARTVGRILGEIAKGQTMYKRTDGKSKQIFHCLKEIPANVVLGTPAVFGTTNPSKTFVRDDDTGISLTVDEEFCKKSLKKKGMTIGELSRAINSPRGVSKEYIYKILESLRQKGFSVSVDAAKKEARLVRSDLETNFEPLKLEPLYRHRIRFGVISDTHYGSRFQQPTLVRTAYDVFDEEKVDFVIHCGDVTDGIKLYRGHDQEVFLNGADEQRDYAIEHYPERKYKTYVIAGNHDLVYKKLAGYSIVEQICKERPDLVYKGEVGAHTFQVKKLSFDVIHPSAGVPYAKSYRIQKMIEGGLGDILDRLRHTKDMSIIPHMMFLGHLHVMCYTPHIGVEGYMVPCMQSITPYLKAKGLHPELGCLVIDIQCDNDWNINKVVLDHRKFNAQIKEDDF